MPGRPWDRTSENAGHINDVAFGPAGVVTFEVDNWIMPGRGTPVSYRPAQAANSGSSIVWTCGYAEPPPGFSLAGANRSDLDPLLLPASCRTTTVRN